MKISFNIHYHTQFGESLQLEITLKNGDIQLLPMDYLFDGSWGGSVELAVTQAPFDYRYRVVGDRTVREEWNMKRRFTVSKGIENYSIKDLWQDLPMNRSFFSSAFTQSFFKRHEGEPRFSQKLERSVRIKVYAPTVPSTNDLVIVGEGDALGNWDPLSGVHLNGSNFPEWVVTLDVDALPTRLEFKFVSIAAEAGVDKTWEDGENRVIDLPIIASGEMAIYEGFHFRAYNPTWSCAGTAIPVFSLRSTKSWGIGDFSDLKTMVDWVAMTNQRIIQVLPINDTTRTHTWRDSYPYNANSIYALHPLYLYPQAIGVLSDKVRQKEFETARNVLNQGDVVDYEAVETLKWDYFKAIYEQQGEMTFETIEFKRWFNANKYWLIPYAGFCWLRDQNRTARFADWTTLQSYDEEEVRRLVMIRNKINSELGIHIFLQYHLHLQLSEVRDYAHENQVVLKGDIPIGVSCDSVEAWVEPQYFNMNGQAGAPPDDFSVKGQNWGFPTYNWEAMAEDGYQWWRRRFQKMADYFDAYRIDHLLGFFRIWEVPMDSVEGLLGYFKPALPFSREELLQMGFHLNDAIHLRPSLHREAIRFIFGENADQAFTQFFDIQGGDYFQLKSEFDTQRKVVAYFEVNPSERSEAFKTALFDTINDVLFIQDPVTPELFHPRITAYYTHAFFRLTDEEKESYMRIYNYFFFERHNEYWKEQAMQKLPALIESTDMLVCAEDLGMIPGCVPEVIRSLQFLSLEIQRMPKDSNQRFAQPRYYSYLSVATTSTHDMSTLRGWWEEDPAATQRYYHECLWGQGEAPAKCEDFIAKMIVQSHLSAPSMLAILPLQDWLSLSDKYKRVDVESERINLPSNPNQYWRYRMHLTLEELLKAKTLNNQIRIMIKTSGR